MTSRKTEEYWRSASQKNFAKPFPASKQKHILLKLPPPASRKDSMGKSHVFLFHYNGPFTANGLVVQNSSLMEGKLLSWKSKAKKGQAWLVEDALCCMSQHVTCPPSRCYFVHAIVSCKGPSKCICLYFI